MVGLGRPIVYMTVTEASLQDGGYQLWIDLERDGLCQVYFAQDMLSMNEYPMRNMERSGQVLHCTVTHDHTWSQGG